MRLKITVTEKAQRTIHIRWVRSGIGFTRRQKEAVRSLGLRWLNHVVERVDTPQVRGLVARIPQLVEIVEKPIRAAVWTALPEYIISPKEVVPVEAEAVAPAPQGEAPAPAPEAAATEVTAKTEEPPRKAAKPAKAAKTAVKKAEPTKASAGKEAGKKKAKRVEKGAKSTKGGKK